MNSHSQLGLMSGEPVSSRLDKTTPDHRTTPTSNETWGKQGNKERVSSKKDRKLKSSSHTHSPSHTPHDGSDSRRSAHLDSATPIHGAVSRDDLPTHSKSEDSPHVSSPAPPFDKGSPQLLRGRHSSDMSSPTHETGDLNFAASPRPNWGVTGALKEGNPKPDKSPEIMVDDVSGSSVSTLSFDHLSMLDSTSPPHLVLQAMENPE